MIAVVAGEVPVTFGTAASVSPHTRSGRLRGLAVTGGQRSALLPELPAIAESGLPGYEMLNWLGMFAPAGTPATVITQLNSGMNRALSSPDVREQMAQQGAEVAYGTPSDLLAAVKTDLTRMGTIVKAAKIEAQ